MSVHGPSRSPAVLSSQWVTAHWVWILFIRVVYCSPHPLTPPAIDLSRWRTACIDSARCSAAVATCRSTSSSSVPVGISSHHPPLQLFLSLTTVHLFSCGGCLWPADMHRVADCCCLVCVCVCVHLCSGANAKREHLENDTARRDTSAAVFFTSFLHAAAFSAVVNLCTKILEPLLSLSPF